MSWDFYIADCAPWFRLVDDQEAPAEYRIGFRGYLDDIAGFEGAGIHVWFSRVGVASSAVSVWLLIRSLYTAAHMAQFRAWSSVSNAWS